MGNYINDLLSSIREAAKCWGSIEIKIFPPGEESTRDESQDQWRVHAREFYGEGRAKGKGGTLDDALAEVLRTVIPIAREQATAREKRALDCLTDAATKHAEAVAETATRRALLDAAEAIVRETGS